MPVDVNTSDDGKTATKFTFPSPVYLQSMAEYCFVVKSNTPEYIMWISDLGQEDSDGNFVSEQPHIGVLFKGHNNRTWDFLHQHRTRSLHFVLQSLIRLLLVQ